ncbi:protein ALTERED PHOSPHATE STARVATION RESPONSE 1-like [Musa acuminata AAA Group]|uniref:protein ALTERED PHOSPHATE STARVATION RESPONSE 1-like n=1 Tax=Musa acuminata AAA Group TaxID=214697 RepID=UPI0031DB5F2D
MGCSSSKVEQQKAVAVCRGRVDLLAAAIRHRYALAAAHAAYSDSLLSVSVALHRVLHLQPSTSSSPVLPLPTHRKSEPSPPPQLVSSARHSSAGSHIHFLPSDSDDDDDDSPFHSGDSSPIHHLDHYGTVPRGPGFGNIYYARKQPPPPSVALGQPPQSYENVQVGYFEPYAASTSHGYPYSYFPGNYGSMGGFFGPSSPPQAMQPPTWTTASALRGSSSSRPPPPPPPPPSTSTWDFLNPFETYENYHHRYTPTWSSREVREEEGIPDLEEEDHDIAKVSYGHQKFASFSSAATGEHSSSMGASTRRTDGTSSVRGSYFYQSRSSAAGRNSSYEPEVVDKNAVTHGVQRSQVQPQNVADPKKILDASDFADEIKTQFERASQCTRELSELLEVGKRHHQPKQSLFEVSARMITVMTPPSSSVSLGFEGDKEMSSKSLASTLQKMYAWERKLYHEVRAEEKMRLLLRRSHKELRRMIERGAEAHKINSTRSLIDKLSTKIRIAIQVVDSISKKINRLRDEELWPRMTELVLGLVRMWNTMLECHQMQHRALSEVKKLDSVISVGKISSSHADEIMQLELEILKWTSNFAAWINAQRNYVKALNGWLVLCLRYEPQETADGVPPYSPRRIGAPPVFIICNCWSQAMDMTSERNVLESVQAFATAVRRLWEQQNIDHHERMIAIRDMDRWLKTLEKNIKDIHKEVDSLNKKLALVPGQIGVRIYQPVFEGHTAEITGTQLGLEKIFEAMQDFTASSVKAYDKLLEHCEEQRMSG